MTKLPIALQLYSIREDVKADMAGSLAKVKELGYDGVEIFDTDAMGTSAADMAKLCAEVGLVCISAHVPFEKLVKNPSGMVRYYSEAGVKYIAIPYLGNDHRPGGAKFAETIEGLRLIGEAARERDITLLYHNHDFEFQMVDGKYGLDVLFDSVSADMLQCEIDTCWVKVAGEKPADYVLKYTGRTPIVHVKDYVGGSSDKMYPIPAPPPVPEYDENGDLIPKEPAAPTMAHMPFQFRPLGTGCQDIPAIVSAAEAAGAVWLVVEQDEATPGKSAISCAAESLKFLKS